MGRINTNSPHCDMHRQNTKADPVLSRICPSKMVWLRFVSTNNFAGKFVHLAGYSECVFASAIVDYDSVLVTLFLISYTSDHLHIITSDPARAPPKITYILRNLVQYILDHT